MNISLFTHSNDTLPRETLTISDFLNGVKFEKWIKEVQPVRDANDKETRKALKEKVPMVTISGSFTKRNQQSLIQHSGFISCDFDHFEDKNQLLTDPYIYALAKSISGTGLFAIIKINPAKHSESFRWLCQYFFNTYGRTLDPAPANIVSTRFVSADPDIYINEGSKVSGTLAETKKKPKSLPIFMPEDKAGELVQECVKRGLNLADSYQNYLALGFALANGFNEGGRTFFHQLASVSEKYKESEADKQYDRCLQGANKSGITVGTFYHFLKSAGIEIKNDSGPFVRTVAMGKKSGKSKEVIVQQLVESNNIKADQAAKLVDSIFGRPDITISSISKDQEHLIESLVLWMQEKHPLRKNKITGLIEENGKVYETEDFNTFYLQARQFFSSPNVTFDLCQRVIFSRCVTQFNPIDEYIEANRYRNTSGNIDSLIASINTSTKYADLFIRKWLIAIIAAHNGYPVRYILTLTGEQHNGKTEFFRRLLPSSLKKYYAESKLDAGKDDEILMCQKLIVMDDEMGGKSKQDEKRLKELASKSVFSLRVPYGRHNEDFKRLAVLCGTSNENEIINDRTGNTRILPVEVISIDYDAYNSIDKDELIMECVRLYESGEDWNFNKSDFGNLTEISKQFETVSSERELILKFFSLPVDGGCAEWLSTTEIKNHIELYSRQQIKGTVKLGIELKKIFGKSKSISVSGISLRKYQVVVINDINQKSNQLQEEESPF
jgi:hypothetical protein